MLTRKASQIGAAHLPGGLADQAVDAGTQHAAEAVEGELEEADAAAEGRFFRAAAAPTAVAIVRLLAALGSWLTDQPAAPVIALAAASRRASAGDMAARLAPSRQSRTLRPVSRWRKP